MLRVTLELIPDVKGDEYKPKLLKVIYIKLQEKETNWQYGTYKVRFDKNFLPSQYDWQYNYIEKLPYKEYTPELAIYLVLKKKLTDNGTLPCSLS